ncbi:MAG: hypothetical protein M3O90_06480 [Actinomycetota bacterium]|nr:hypothetical protein [Actinomycetota bacterium]
MGHQLNPADLLEYFFVGVAIAIVSYGAASAGLGFAAFFVVPAIAAPLVIAYLRCGRGQEQEVGEFTPSPR